MIQYIKNFFKSSIDIGSKEHPELSNFNEYFFKFYGKNIHSMEGLLQGIKFEDIEIQNNIFSMHGKKAKFKGKKSKWYIDQILYFQGQAIKRDSAEYQNFLQESFYALFVNNPIALKALIATGNRRLRHSIGKNDITKTVLTEKEFCSILTKLRKRLQSNF